LRPLIGIVAGEESGDILGADLILSLKQHFPLATFEGVGGKRMQNAGLKSLYPLERLAVMGLIEPLKRLPELLAMRKGLRDHFLKAKPDIFIGIDAPDFNLSLEQSLKAKGIKTAHYVSPTVWAWRKRRIHKIKKAVDLMLTLFPFETKIYEDHGIPVCCVGHTLADQIPWHSDKSTAREELALPISGKIVALLPGSRAQELKYLAKEFIQTAKWLREQDSTIQFISAAPNEFREQQFKAYQEEISGPPIQIFRGRATTVMAAADAILCTSGTATLQAMLVKRPTIIAYKMSPLVFSIAKRIIKVPYIGLPNLLAEKCVMPEFIQSDVQAAKMGEKLLGYLRDSNQDYSDFERVHQLLKKNAGESSAQAVAQLINI